MNEATLPTINDLRAVVAELIANGFGELPIQIVVAPDSTLQALARRHANESPVLMIEYSAGTERQPVSIISTARLSSGKGRMPSLATQ